MDPADAVLDTTRPNGARVWHEMGGGHLGFAADRQLARDLVRLCPQIGEMPGDCRQFTGRAVTWAAGQGITQFLDLGCGLPARPGVHQIAADVVPGARVAYVDLDEVVIAHTGALYGTDRGVAVARADLADPAAVLAHPSVREVIDPAAPVCVLLSMVLHYLPAAAARAVVSGYAGLLAPGSVIAVTVPRCADPELWRPVHDHDRAGVTGWFGSGLELVPPGVALARAWRPGWPDAYLSPGGPVYVLGAVARIGP